MSEKIIKAYSILRDGKLRLDKIEKSKNSWSLTGYIRKGIDKIVPITITYNKNK